MILNQFYSIYQDVYLFLHEQHESEEQQRDSVNRFGAGNAEIF
jgi:hypothetical protein